MAHVNSGLPSFDKELAAALCNLEVPSCLNISPNGQKIVYVTSLGNGSIRKGENKLSTLWVGSTSEPDSARPLTSGQARDVSPAWHPDGNRIAFLSDRGNLGGGRTIWMLRLDGGDAVQISDSNNRATIESFAFSPDGDMIAYTSADEKSNETKDREMKNGGAADPAVWGDDAHQRARLRLLSVKTGKTATLDTGDGHVTDFHWSLDGKSIVLGKTVNTDGEEMFLTGTNIVTVAIEGGITTEVCVVHHGIDALTWAPDGKIYYIGSVSESALSGVAVHEVDPMQTPASPLRVLGGFEDDPSSMVVAGGKLFVSRNVRRGTVISDKSGKVYFEKPLAFRDWDVHHSSEQDGWHIAACLSDINTPTEVVVSSDDEQSLITLSEHGKSFKDREFGSFHVLTCPSSDDAVELDGIFLAPAGVASFDGNSAPTKPLPTAVLIHGGPTDRDFNSFNNLSLYWVPYLLSKGYGVLLPQYRGSYGRGSRFAAYSVTGHGRDNYSDVISITNNAVQRGYADGKKLLVGGWSMGGLLTYMCSVRNGQHGLGWHFNAAIAGAGICDMDSLALASDLGASVLAELSGGKTPWTQSRDDTSARRGSALWEVAGASAEARRTGQMIIPPMLILHGDQDDRAPFTQSQGFRRALRAHKLPCEFVAYTGQGHTPSPMSHWLDMLERVARWCYVYIGPGLTLEDGKLVKKAD
ncbi:hypothetical protein PWT90_08206 [Aphanocladium album]|nr:hypothetical protein PWT90_08206 [Aphanocladium album]